jgi:hypothetical protein
MNLAPSASPVVPILQNIVFSFELAADLDFHESGAAIDVRLFEDTLKVIGIGAEDLGENVGQAG